MLGTLTPLMSSTFFPYAIARVQQADCQESLSVTFLPHHSNGSKYCSHLGHLTHEGGGQSTFDYIIHLDWVPLSEPKVWSCY